VNFHFLTQRELPEDFALGTKSCFVIPSQSKKRIGHSDSETGASRWKLRGLILALPIFEADFCHREHSDACGFFEGDDASTYMQF
jgi:hypothetical protein